MELEKETLDKTHKVSLYILIAFDKFCRENNLMYFLDSGTALGAIRHGGFIPWDDDVDVGMPRKDYERFLQIGQEKLPEEFFIQTRETDPTFRRHAAKLRLKGTIFPERDKLQFRENGFFIDIFPFDNVSNNKCAAKIDAAISRYLYHIIRLWRSSENSSTRVLRLLQRLIKKIPEAQIEWLDRKWVKFCRKHENNNTGCVTSYFWFMAQYDTYIFDASKLFPVKDVLFEGYPFKIVQMPDYYLKMMYGDYMTLPPIEKRHFHLKGEVDFGNYA